ncbi:head GIN domain-containing protein [Ideonella sp. DXS29W]|uniref:Head GIN domain-containing protein n=1 Tax=Ideonella lacteola TaxID=2984193 RepID=A0ABU9BLF2_9BURK
MSQGPRHTAALMAAPLMTVLLSLISLAASPTAQATTIEIQTGMFNSRVQGSGNVIEDKRAIGAFTKLRLDSAITVNARPAGSPGVVVRADDNIAPLILTTVEGDTLVVKVKPNMGIRTDSPLVVNVDFTKLTQADLRGSGDLNVSAIKGEQFELSLAGSGDVRIDNAELTKLVSRLAGSGDIWVKGKCDDAGYNIAGSGDVHAGEMQAKRVNVDIAGSGDVRVHASEALAVQIAGSGDVAYSGNPPKVSSRVVGSGDLRAVR